ncbi:MAG TPA: hypothetical protein VFV01_47850 [Spirillospora sp.]|nr:hypothetical protein [Spirillospora sp.]
MIRRLTDDECGRIVRASIDPLRRLGGRGEDVLLTTAEQIADDIARQAVAEALAPVRALVEAEVADTIDSRVRHARGDVRCLSCGLRYDERQQYGCQTSGRAHTYDDGDLADAEAAERAEPVEYVTLPMTALRAALRAAEGGGDGE